MGFASVELDESEDPLTIGLLGAVGIVGISQDLSDLIHEAQLGIRSGFLLDFHGFPIYCKHMEN
jgi:hypothetical protein